VCSSDLDVTLQIIEEKHDASKDFETRVCISSVSFASLRK